MSPSHCSCSYCNKFVSNTCKRILCTLCGSWCHLCCTDLVGLFNSSVESHWFCGLCTLSLFPFNHIEDEREFLSSVSNCTLNVRGCRDIIFEPVDHYEDGRTLLLDQDIDADINLFTGRTVCASTYLNMEQVSGTVAKLKYRDNLSVAHLNCRSLFYKLAEIQIMLSLTKATVLAVTET